MHFEHTWTFETSMANFTLWLSFAVGLKNERKHNFSTPSLLSTKISTFIQFECDFIWFCIHRLCLNSFLQRLQTYRPGDGQLVCKLMNSAKGEIKIILDDKTLKNIPSHLDTSFHLHLNHQKCPMQTQFHRKQFLPLHQV